MPDIKPRPSIAPPSSAPQEAHPSHAWGRVEAFCRAFEAAAVRVMSRLSPALHPTALVIGVPSSGGVAGQLVRGILGSLFR